LKSLHYEALSEKHQVTHNVSDILSFSDVYYWQHNKTFWEHHQRLQVRNLKGTCTEMSTEWV